MFFIANNFLYSTKSVFHVATETDFKTSLSSSVDAFREDERDYFDLIQLNCGCLRNDPKRFSLERLLRLIYCSEME